MPRIASRAGGTAWKARSQTLSGVPAGTRLLCAQGPGAEAAGLVFVKSLRDLDVVDQVSPPCSRRPQIRPAYTISTSRTGFRIRFAERPRWRCDWHGNTPHGRVKAPRVAEVNLGTGSEDLHSEENLRGGNSRLAAQSSKLKAQRNKPLIACFGACRVGNQWGYLPSSLLSTLLFPGVMKTL